METPPAMVGVAATLIGMSGAVGLPAFFILAIGSGALYGVIVFLFMNLVIIPLSAMPKISFTLSGVMTQVLIHIFCVGLPISLAASRFCR